MPDEIINKKPKANRRRGRKSKKESLPAGEDVVKVGGNGTNAPKKSAKTITPKNVSVGHDKTPKKNQEKSESCPEKSCSPLRKTALKVDEDNNGSTNDKVLKSDLTSSKAEEGDQGNGNGSISAKKNENEDAASFPLSQKIIPRFSKKRKATTDVMKDQSKSTKMSDKTSDISNCSVLLEYLPEDISTMVKESGKQEEPKPKIRDNAIGLENEPGPCSTTVGLSTFQREEEEPKIVTLIQDKNVDNTETHEGLIIEKDKEAEENGGESLSTDNLFTKSEQKELSDITEEKIDDVTGEDKKVDEALKNPLQNREPSYAMVTDSAQQAVKDKPEIMPLQSFVANGENLNGDSELSNVLSFCLTKLEPLQDLALTDSQLCELDVDMDQEQVQTENRPNPQVIKISKPIKKSPKPSKEGGKAKPDATNKTVKSVINELQALNRILLKARRDMESYKRRRAALIAPLRQINQF